MAKRTLDLLAVGLLAPVAIPAAALVALAVLLDSPGPVIYRAARVGRNETSFAMLKFRTMRTNIAGHSIASEGDSRITPVGAFLRATRLDEIPQLWNVVRGEMSFVGPRPELKKFVDLHAEEYREILSVPPGITGPTQLRYAGQEPKLLGLHADPERYYRDELLPDKVRLDLEYARSRSISLDLAVLGRTIAIPFPTPPQASASDPRRRAWRSLAIGGTALVGAPPLIFMLALGSPR